MARLVAIDKAMHAAHKWRRPDGFGFTIREAVVPIVALELGKVAPVMPTAFIGQHGHFELAAVLSAASGQNLFVAPDGRWLGGYVPSMFRTYPFRLAKPEGVEPPILCVDESCVISADDALPGELFFGADGEISASLKQIIDFISAVERNRIATSIAVSSLAQAGVIKPWPITIKSEQGERTVNGLNCIDEAALNALPTEEFIKLRSTGALPIAYAQLLSMNQIGVFQHLAKLQTQLSPKPIAPLPDTLDKLFDASNNEYLRFD